MFSRKQLATVLVATFGALGLASCSSAADTASENLSKEAENFEVPRRIVGINTLAQTPEDSVLFSVEGFCSYETEGATFDVICLVDRNTGAVQRTSLGKADNVTFVVTQIGSKSVDLFRPKVILRPTTILPDFDLSTPANP